MSTPGRANVTGDELKILLTEYAKAQDSAEHHDTLLWTVVGILISGMAALFGFALRYYGQPPRWKFVILAVLGILICSLIFFFVCSFGKIRNLKYERCKRIEKCLGMRQHRALRNGFGQRYVVYSLTTIFLIGWVVWLTCAFCRQRRPFVAAASAPSWKGCSSPLQRRRLKRARHAVLLHRKIPELKPVLGTGRVFVGLKAHAQTPSMAHPRRLKRDTACRAPTQKSPRGWSPLLG